MMTRQTPRRLRLPSDGFLRVLLTLLVYHSSMLTDLPFSSSSSSSSSSSACSSTLDLSARSLLASQSSARHASWLLASWWHTNTAPTTTTTSSSSAAAQQQQQRRGGSFFGGGSSGAGASSVCVMGSEQRRLTEMLNELQTFDDLDPGRLPLQQIWNRDRHNLTGVCPTFRPGGYPSLPGLEQQSMCPWTLQQNYRTDRFPRLLWFARCMCGHCQASEYVESGNLYTCVPLYHRVAVIREVCQDGELHFRWARESVPVGCVCAHPNARQIP